MDQEECYINKEEPETMVTGKKEEGGLHPKEVPNWESSYDRNKYVKEGDP